MMLHVAPSSFEVIQLQSEREGGRYSALREQFPRLDKLVGELQKRRADAAAAYGQQYQIDLIRGGTFEIPSLTTDRVSHAVASLLINDKCVFYAFDHDPDLILGASLLAEGFPLTAIVIPSMRVMINLGDPLWGMGQEHLRALQTLGVQYPVERPGEPDPRRVTVVTGEPNFAHHLWNQLTAFEALAASEAATHPLDIVATHQPLGPLRDLFPEAHDWAVTYSPDTYLESRNGTGRMFVALGGFLISRRVRARVNRFAQSRLSEHAGSVVERIGLARRPTFWFSIRSRNRTPLNQTEALVSLSRAVLGAYPTACIILDGHSLPDDFERNPSYDRSGTLALVELDREVAADVIDELRSSGAIGDRQDVIPLVGSPILDSLAVASLADVYFCHHGTVQHKIGWLTDVPGIVHCNARTLALRPAQWVAQKVEDGIAPVYIDPTALEDEDRPGDLSEIEDSLRVECYRFADVEALARDFLQFSRRIVGDASDLEKGHERSVERISMRPFDSSDFALPIDAEPGDRLGLQRELLRIRNELMQTHKAKEAATAELVELARRLRIASHDAETASADAARARDELAQRTAEHDDLDRENARLSALMQAQESELVRRNLVARRLNDELVRRDLEIADLRAGLLESERRLAELQVEFQSRMFSTEQLLVVLQQQKSAFVGRRVLDDGSAAPVPDRARRVISRLRRVVGRVRAAVMRRIGAG